MVGEIPQTIQVINPDGVTGEIPASNLQQALMAGYKQVPTTGAPVVPVAGAAPEANDNYKQQVMDKLQPFLKKEDIPENDPGHIYMVNPDEQRGLIPIENVPKALTAGYKIQSDWHSDKLVNMFEDKYGAGVPVINFVESLANGILLGQGENALHKVNNVIKDTFGEEKVNGLLHSMGMSSLPSEAVFDALEKLHNKYPTTSTVGNVVGVLAPTIATGGAGLLGEGTLAAKAAAGVKAAVGTSSAMARIAGAVGGEALAGGVVALPQAAAAAAFSPDPKLAGETLTLGMLAGGGLGLLMQGGSEGIQAAVNTTKQMAQSGVLHANVDRFADQMLEEALGMTPKERAALGTPEEQATKLSKFVNFIGDKNVKNSHDLAEQINKMVTESGSSTGELLDSLDSFQSRDFRSLRPNVTAQKMAMQAEMDKLEGPLRAPEKKAVENAIEQLDTIAKGRTNISFAEQQKYKKLLQNEVNYKGDASDYLNNTRTKLAAMANSEMERAADAVSAMATNKYDPGGNFSISQKWQDYKEAYGVAKQLEPFAEKTINQPPIILDALKSHHLYGGIVGHMVGGIVGIPMLGTLVGALTSKPLMHWVRDRALTRMGVYLKKMANNPNLPVAIAMDANAIAQSKIAEIPKLLRAGTVDIATTNKDAIKSALGEQANGLSQDQQFKRLSDQINGVVANPALAQQQIKSLTEPFSFHMPEVGKSLEDSLMAKIQFLHENLPKQMSAPVPFAKDQEWKPSAQQIDDFKKILAVAEDPFHVIHELKNGTLTTKQVGALSVMNPAILSRIREEIMKEGYSGKSDLTYQQRLSASILLGQSLAEGMSQVHNLQSIYGPNSAANQPAGPPPKKAGKGGSHLNSDKMPGAQYTQAQRQTK